MQLPVSPDILVPLLGLAWLAYTAVYITGRTRAEPMLRRWAEREGVRILRARPRRISVFNAELLLKVSPLQRVYEAIGTRGSRTVLLVVRLGHPWLGCLREEVAVITEAPWDGILDAR